MLQFHSTSIQLLTNFNKLLQREEPTTHILQDAMKNLGKKLASRIVLPNILRDTAVVDIDLNDDAIFKPTEQIFLGGMTKANLTALLNNGDISESDFNKVLDAAHCYFQYALVYLQKKFPLTNELLANAKWIDVPNRIKINWNNVEYFLDRYHDLLSDTSVEVVYDEFLDFQTLLDTDIEAKAWEEAKVIDGEEEGVPTVFHYRVDVLWWHIANLKIPGTNVPRFSHLFKVAEIVLVLPNSNAEEERLFSIVRKNKTDSLSSLKLDGTLSSILAMKSRFQESVVPCYKWQPEEEVLKNAKKATLNCNKKCV